MVRFYIKIDNNTIWDLIWLQDRTYLFLDIIWVLVHTVYVVFLKAELVYHFKMCFFT